MGPLEGIIGGIQPGGKNIGHRDQFHGPGFDAQRLLGRAASPAPASDQRNIDRVVFGGMHMGNRHASQSGNSGHTPGILQKFATRGRLGRLIFVHIMIFLTLNNCCQFGKTGLFSA
jgi:hypothetical protein